MSEENKAAVRRWVETFNDGDVDMVDELVTDSYVRHDPNSPEVRGPGEEKQLIAMYHSAFPDLRFTIEDMVAEGDKVVIPDEKPTSAFGDRDLPFRGGQDR